MKKEILVALIAIGFIFAGAITASAGTITWTMVQTAGMKLHSPGADNRIGTADDGLTDKCNYSDATSCPTTGTPTTGAYSFAKLNFVQNSSCALAALPAKIGDPCSTNADCGPGICTDCNTPGKVGLGYFAKNPSGGSKGLGTMSVTACDGSFTYTNMAIGTSEVVGISGGGCMTLGAGPQSTTGCGVGGVTTMNTLNLWIADPIFATPCGFQAGLMPNISLAGQIMAAPSGGAAVCSYSATQVNNIMADAGMGAGQYLLVICGAGTLPSDLQSACLRSASWNSILVAKTSSVAACSEACSSGGCMAGTAEDVE